MLSITQRIIRSLPQEYNKLADRIDRFNYGTHKGRLHVALQFGQDPIFLDYEGPGTLRTVDGAWSLPVCAGCLVKPLTASLLAEAVLAGSIDWTSHINEVLAVGGASGRNLAGITLSHLLNHTHGLDDSMIESLPHLRNGYIDATALYQQLNSSRISAPGELYSYSNAGSWLAGAVLERLSRRPYSQLLRTSRWIASTASWQTSSVAALCPATGGALALTMPQWLSFVSAHADSCRLSTDPLSRGLASLRSSRVSLPGWSASEQSACLGWKHYGEGWFGHTANMPTSITFMRFNPTEHISIVMSASSDIALYAFSSLFQDYLWELKNLKFPRRLTSAESRSLRLHSYLGTYVQARTRIEIAIDEGGLLFSIASVNPALRVPTKALRAAENNIFFPEGTLTPEFSFIQFVRAPHSDMFSHVWNGKCLWRRE